MKFFLRIIIIVFLFGCSKEDTTNYYAYFKNSTAHNIIILPFKSGTVNQTDTIKLFPQQQIKFAGGVHRGLVSVPGFSSQHFGGPEDSIIVTFDNTYKISHYSNTPLQKATKYYLFVSLRNIGNPLSYRFESKSLSKHMRENNHYYEFTEQDYLDAK